MFTFNSQAFGMLVTLGGLIAVGSHAVRAETINIPSNAGWEVWTNPPAPAVSTFLGPSQNVCLDANTPANCSTANPPATIYGYTQGGWEAMLPAVPNPHWMWAPGVTGPSRPAEDQSYVFKSTFFLCGPPQDSKVWLSADDRADVYVNGNLVLSNSDQSKLDNKVVSAALLRSIPGHNTIEIRATNGQNPNSCGQGTANTNGAYSCNPAGVVFNGTFEDALTPWPRCSATMPPGTTTYHVGQSEDLGTCPVGWTGRIYHTCICSFNATGTVVGDWAMPVNTCTPPPAKRSICLDFDGSFPNGVYGSAAGQPPGTQAFANSGVSVTVEALPTGLFDSVLVENYVVGAGARQSLRFRGAGLRFDFGGLGFTPAKLSFEFDYKGGEYSFKTDSSVSHLTQASRLLSKTPPSPLPTIGNSVVSVSPLPSGASSNVGTMTLVGGSPRWLEIGGVELWIDNLCISE